jgi:hypothetical protein
MDISQATKSRMHTASVKPRQRLPLYKNPYEHLDDEISSANEGGDADEEDKDDLLQTQDDT